MEEKKDSVSTFMLNKTYLEDFTNMVEICSKKCFSNYDSPVPNSNEQQCMEKCYFKTLELTKYLKDEYNNDLDFQY